MGEVGLPYISREKKKPKVGASDAVGGILHIKRRLYLYLTAAHFLSALPRSLAHWDLPTLIYYVSLGWGSFSRGSGAISHVQQRASKVTAFKDDNFQIMGPHCFHPHTPPPHPTPLLSTA